MKRIVICLIATVWANSSAQAEVRVSNLFSDNLVLQRDIPAAVWGTAEPGEKVTVKIGASQATVDAGPDGKWQVQLPAQKMNATPQELTIRGTNTLNLKNVLIGDVWVCSGQSNMEMNVGGCGAPEDVAGADLPTLRRIKVDHRAIAEPTSEISGRWEVCTPHTAAGFTAVGFYFARRIHKETGVPIGLIDDNWGGTAIEPWMAPAAFELPQLDPVAVNIAANMKNRTQAYREHLGKSLDALEKWIGEARQALAAPGSPLRGQPPLPQDPRTDAGFPTAFYNGMIYPIVPFAIKGALWYQGEANGGEGDEYAAKMQALVGGWRKIWAQGNFPFYFVQLANLGGPNDNPAGGDGWARIRSAQTKALQIVNSGMAVTTDVGEANDIHPKNKFDVGERLARWALRNDYGKSDLVASGPLYKSMKVEDGKIRLTFDWVGGGLIVGKKNGRQPTEEVKGDKLKRFAIAGEDKQWVWADAVIDGDSVIVSSPKVAKPVAVRYAFTMNPEGANLYNKEGLPASSFRTDAW